MTKVGEGKELPHQPSALQYQKDVEKNASKFLKALDEYEGSTDDKQRAHFKDVMDQSLALIRSAVSELHRGGIRKQEGGVESDYKAYINNESPDNLNALKQDISSLRDNNNQS